MSLKKGKYTLSINKTHVTKWQKSLKERNIKEPQIKPRTTNTTLYVSFISIKKTPQKTKKSNVTITENRIQGKFYQFALIKRKHRT